MTDSDGLSKSEKTTMPSSVIREASEHKIIEKRAENPFRRKVTVAKIATKDIGATTTIPVAILPTALFQLRTNTGQSMNIRAICDTGAQVNVVSRECVARLALSTKPIKINVAGIGNKPLSISEAVEGLLCNRHGDCVSNELIKFLVVPKVAGEMPTQDLEEDQHKVCSEQDLADPKFHKRAKTDAILGVGVLSNIMEHKISSNTTGLRIQKTLLGNIIMGNSQDHHMTETNGVFTITSDEHLVAGLQKLWEIEQITKEMELKPEDRWCEENFRSTVRRSSNGRYIVTIPIRPGKEAALGQSREAALQRFRALERQFVRDPEFRQWYIGYMRELQQTGYMQLATRPPNERQPQYYIPHHGVRPPKKPRVVFDASAITSTGVSYNDIQITGPRLQDDLPDIVTRFRERKVAMSADVHKMFPQVQVAEHQWDLQRIFWRETEAEPISEYWLVRVTFGMASSTYNAVKAMQHCVEQYKEQFPLAYEAVHTSFYVDDFLKSVHTVEKALATREQLEASLGKGCFPLAKWASNETSMLLESEKADTKTLEQVDSTSVLGLLWRAKDDILCFKVKPLEAAEKVTKRTIASEGAKIYDPMGYLAPVTIRAKVFMQQAWRVGYAWDAAMDEEAASAWKAYRDSLPTLGQVQIPRWLGITANCKVQLHTFCDASNIAYGAVVYSRAEHSDGTVEVRIVASKNKLAPIQSVTIPRLELSAAAVGAELGERMSKILGIPTEQLYFWSDSQIVLHWIRKSPSDAKIFVGNRIAIVQEHSNVQKWAHVSSKQNPADLLSRGLRAQELAPADIWWNGPDFLKDTQEQWPQWQPTKKLQTEEQSMAEEEMRKKYVIEPPVLILTLSGQSGQDAGSMLHNLLSLRSSLQKALRVTAYVYRYVRALRQRAKAGRLRGAMVAQILTRKRKAALEATGKADGRPSPKKANINESTDTNETVPMNADRLVVSNNDDTPMRIATLIKNAPAISYEECSTALAFWIRYTQQTEFPIEHQRLSAGKPVQRESKIFELTPTLDEHGIIRMTGRLARAELTNDQINPIILPVKSILVQRLIQQAHTDTKHGGLRLCLQYLRDKYWIPRVRTAVKGHIRNCVTCERYRAKTCEQLMADLPAARVLPSRPFRNCGVDFAGPFRIAEHSRRGAPTISAYLCIFVDFPTKAAHLELTSDLTTQAFLAALDRMIVRRGRVEHMHSDNGLNFVGAANELRRLLEQWDKNELESGIAQRQIHWHFNTPRAPHHGGLWEALVKQVKFLFYREYANYRFTYEEMNTAVVRIEGCLNSRPLTALKDDPTDLTALTPAHFLVGDQLVRPLGPNVLSIPSNRLVSWERIHKFEQSIWSRFSQEYLSELQKRNKWQEPQRELKVNDLVFVKEDNLPPGMWKRARVVKVYTGRDGHVRSARIRTGQQFYDRPIVKLCRIPVDPTLRIHDQACEAGACEQGCTVAVACLSVQQYNESIELAGV